jgi:hypothetical protein
VKSPIECGTWPIRIARQFLKKQYYQFSELNEKVLFVLKVYTLRFHFMINVSSLFLVLILSPPLYANQNVDVGLVGTSYRLHHPRLPHPDDEYLERIRNTKGLLKKLKRNRNFKSKTDLLSMYLATKDPVLLKKIKKLATTDFKGMWFHKIDILAVAYDWIYDDLDEVTRNKFLERIVKLTGEAINYYKKSRISPYNDVGYVRLHNSFFIGALVSYPDHPKGEEFIRFSNNILFNVYLPVWQQIIGEGGGWHEGIEYIQVGIGNVIVPTLLSWGYATGRDLFQENPWLQQLIYYPIYTTRPDKTPLRISDLNSSSLSKFNGMRSLTIVYNNPFGRWWLTKGRGFRDNIAPGAWPWFPPDPLDAPNKPVSKLPLHHYFKSLGIVIMRSDWTEDGVYASFKTGDNYWSHQHFDSGAFTIYRRGALAIDSGTYHAGYSSDHHMKYQMQTIAHNSMTVTDPDDVSHGSRIQLPNDGGQRRVGSGGYNNSPDNISDWLKKKDDYEMGDIVNISLNNYFVYVCGDVTAAYTNKNSGDGDYKSRTKRVRKWFRDFLYIRPEIFVIFDRVVSYNDDFTKRWLLHSINEPEIDGRQITLFRTDKVHHRNSWSWGLKHVVDKKRKFYQYNGQLVVTTILPKNSTIKKVGGAGHEFDIQGINYNKNIRGKPIPTDPKKGPIEPGAWRIEISPQSQKKDDLFLNVLIPFEANQKYPYHVEEVKVIYGEIVGSRISASGDSIYALFNKRTDNYALNQKIAYEIHNNDESGRHYLFGLKPFSSFDMNLEDNPKGTKTIRLVPSGDEDQKKSLRVDKNGILQFDL